MTWRRRKTKAPCVTPETIEARKALSKAEKDLSETRERVAEVNEITQPLKIYAERNNFAALIAEAMGGSP